MHLHHVVKQAVKTLALLVLTLTRGPDRMPSYTDSSLLREG